MPVEVDSRFPGKFDSRTLSRETLNRWTGRTVVGSHVILCSRASKKNN